MKLFKRIFKKKESIPIDDDLIKLLNALKGVKLQSITVKDNEFFIEVEATKDK